MNSFTIPMRMPATSCLQAARKSALTCCDVQSSSSWPQMASMTAAASSTLRAKGPTWSSELPKATTP